MVKGNDYFQFKQFRIDQGDCAMKVTTDACIQGAWTPVASGVSNILDIGTGTGLLSLMLAQANPSVIIDAIEIEPQAAMQARTNCSNSPWANKINVLEADVREYTKPTQYDLIITNPPFFNNSLLGQSQSKNAARHTLSLSYADLLLCFEKLLNPTGYVSIILPADEYNLMEEMAAQKGWNTLRKLSIRHRHGAPAKRTVALFSKTGNNTSLDEELVIKDQNDQYTRQFIDLLSPYYLHL